MVLLDNSIDRSHQAITCTCAQIRRVKKRRESRKSSPPPSRNSGTSTSSNPRGGTRTSTTSSTPTPTPSITPFTTSTCTRRRHNIDRTVMTLQPRHPPSSTLQTTISMDSQRSHQMRHPNTQRGAVRLSTSSCYWKGKSRRTKNYRSNSSSERGNSSTSGVERGQLKSPLS